MLPQLRVSSNTTVSAEMIGLRLGLAPDKNVKLWRNLLIKKTTAFASSRVSTEVES